MRCGHKILQHFRAVKFGEGLTGFVLITGVAAGDGQAIGCKRHESVERQAPGDILNMRVQSTVFMHDQNSRQLVACTAGRAGQVAFDTAGAIRGWVAHAFCAQSGVVLAHLLAGCKVGTERGQQTSGRHASLGKLLGLV